MITIILHEPEVAGNVGAIARLMSNFGFSNLTIINPKCDVKSLEAEGRAKHARFILKNATITNEKILDSFDTLIGTTGRVGSDFNIPRAPLTPKQAAELITPHITKKHSLGILFGNEGKGLSNEIIRHCEFTITIPSEKKYQTLNLSHAAGIILYEISLQQQDKQHSTSHFRPATRPEKKAFLHFLDGIIDTLNWPGLPIRKQTQKLIWRKLLAKSFLTKREIFGLFGFFRKLQKK